MGHLPISPGTKAEALNFPLRVPLRVNPQKVWSLGHCSTPSQRAGSPADVIPRVAGMEVV